METLPKIIGSDIELGNFLLGVEKLGGTGREASRLLLAQMPGVMTTHDFGGLNRSWSTGSSGTYGNIATWDPVDPRDFGRRWMSNGGCCYIDSDHLEIATPETTNAWDWAAAYYAQLGLVADAQRRVSQELAPGTSIQVFAANSDGKGNSWGSHLNFLLTRRAFLNIFERRMHYLIWLASLQASSVIINGLGKVGSENGHETVDYQLSQRADHFEEIVSHNTMTRRPIINARDESHCYPYSDFARFHHIACDSNLCPVANVLKVGILQIVLAMVENESDFVSSSILLESPLDAWRDFSRDPSLTAVARTIDGDLMSALDLQRLLFDSAARFYAAGGCEEVVPRADEILALWSTTLDLLAGRDWDRLAGRLDWVLKQKLIEEAFESSPELSWHSPEAKYLDICYSSLLPDEGLFWPCLDSGAIEQVVDEKSIERFKKHPPDNTRAYTRGHLIGGRGDYQIESANWDCVCVRFHAAGGHGRVRTVYMDSPYGSTVHDHQTINNPKTKEQPLCNSRNVLSNTQPTKFN